MTHPAWQEAASDALWLADALEDEPAEAGLMLGAATTARLRSVATLADAEGLPRVAEACREELHRRRPTFPAAGLTPAPALTG